MAHFEVYILNYNGIRFLPNCLDALRSVDRGPHSMSVNVIDNNSQDGSEELIEQEYPEVRYIPLDKNYGFSAGNNLGVSIRIAEHRRQGTTVDFHVLLNNDTEVDSNWLLAAFETFERNPRAGIVGSKAVFADHFIPIEIECENSFTPADFGIPDEREMGAVMHYGYAGSNVVSSAGRIKIKDVYPGMAHACVLQKKSQIHIPVENPKRDAWVALYLENHHPEYVPLSISVKIGKYGDSQRVSLAPGVVTPLLLNAGSQEFIECIQNAGSFVTNSCYAGDRGFLTPNGEDFNETERVAAVCGVSMFVRHEVWLALRGFDEAFFAYYEDTDLSIRAQQLGWECYYTPNSTLRHVHCGSGVEYSEYFKKNVAWSHLLFASKTMNRSQWKAKLSESRRSAKAEFSQFENDHALESKPNLYAYIKYLQHYPLFLKNRFRANAQPVFDTIGAYSANA